MTRFFKASAVVGLFACLNATGIADSGKEFPPPQGKARVVMLASGMSGPDHYVTVARELAAFGYDVVLFDGNPMEGTKGEGVKTAITQAQQMPHALPGKVALVGFSLGGGECLYYGTQWPDLVAGAVVWYPATSFIQNVPGFAARLKVPVLMFAGGKDNFRNGCCTAAKAGTLATAATGAGQAFELITYPDADHDFVKGGNHYDAKSYADALQRTVARLKQYFGTN